MGNRESLLEGAIESLKLNGYAGSTARELCRLSETSLAAIGYHFGSKDALLNEALALAFGRWIDRLAEAAANAHTRGRGEAAIVLLDEIATLYASDRRLLAAFFEAVSYAQRDEDLRQQLASQYDDVRTAIAEIVAPVLAVEADESTRREVASVVLALIDGLAVQSLLDPASAPTGASVVYAVEALVR